MSVLLCDMDGILTDFNHRTADLYSRVSGKRLSVDGFKEFNLTAAMDPAYHHWFDEIMKDQSFFESLSPLPGAVAGLELLSRRHEVYIVSAPARKAPNSASGKIKWCAQHLTFLPPRRVILADTKELVRGDIFIDDSPTKLTRYKDAWPRARIATITYPYNKDTVVDVRAESCLNTVAAWRQLSESL